VLIDLAGLDAAAATCRTRKRAGVWSTRGDVIPYDEEVVRAVVTFVAAVDQVP
jgi:hypothetical protein